MAFLRELCLTLAACAACAAPARSSAGSPPIDVTATPEPVRGGHAAVDLSGTWITGSEGEPAAARISLHPQCNSNPGYWLLEQSGDTLRAWTIAESESKGTPSGSPTSSVPASGWVSGTDAVIGLPDSRYVLRYDSASGHLRGTLNGAPFWAVRVDIIRREGGIPVP